MASRDIFPGEVIEESMISIMRPGNGLSTNYIDKIIGKKAKQTINKYQLFRIEDFI